MHSSNIASRTAWTNWPSTISLQHSLLSCTSTTESETYALLTITEHLPHNCHSTIIKNFTNSAYFLNYPTYNSHSIIIIPEFIEIFKGFVSQKLTTFFKAQNISHKYASHMFTPSSHGSQKKEENLFGISDTSFKPPLTNLH
ncbi:8990_t:CDS:2 [Ambispora gerdemannii]|uniref:8990_t:CDS:1 n=1 Tax=Ambispora gerdemannii TaxID=144530 RepID=A0A9N9C262_9GLOM|nr:8990_t:CDS:2 [Ambispora gerdemannii]